MNASLRDRLAFWLERFGWLHPWLLAHDGEFNGQTRYRNRLNGHIVMGGELR